MLFPFEWLQSLVDVRASPHEVAEAFTMAGVEVQLLSGEGDQSLFEVSVTPNRGDCLSLLGLARELAAIYNIPLKWQPRRLDGGRFEASKLLSVKIRDDEKCRRYTANVIRGVCVGPSPDYIQRRLIACGIRPLNTVVDATNYIMLESGQPLHAFDLRQIKNGLLEIRSGSTDTLTLLNGQEYALSKEDLAIWTEGGILALAGVMGGAQSGIASDTTDIVLESAYFDPKAVRRASRRSGVMTESSRRFERTVDPNRVDLALDQLAALIIQIAGGEASADIIDIYPKPIKALRIPLSLGHINRLLGTALKSDDVISLLKRLQISAEVIKDDQLEVLPPTGRPDLERPVDIIEEIGRLYGYEKISCSMPAIPLSPVILPEHESSHNHILGHLVSLGFSESIHYGFASTEAMQPYAELGEPVLVANPLGNEATVLKNSLIGALVEAVDLNIRHQCDAGRLFEMRPVFFKKGKEVVQSRQLGMIIFGRREPLGWCATDKSVDIYDMIGIVESLASQLGSVVTIENGEEYSFLHPKESAIVTCAGEKIGYIGMLHPSIAGRLSLPIVVAELTIDKWLDLRVKKQLKYRELSAYPTVRRDVSFLVDQAVRHRLICDTILSAQKEHIKQIKLFDLYTGKGIPEGKKSVAYAIWYEDPMRTLTDEEVGQFHDSVINRIVVELGGEIR